MLFRRTVEESASWVGVSHSGGVLHAARACHLPGQKPQLLSLTLEPTTELSEGLQVLRQAHLIKGARLCGVFDRAQYRLLSVEVPDIPQTEWRDAMRWRLKEHVDFPMDDALLDILAVPDDTQLRQTHTAMALVAQRADYNRWAIAADDVGMRWHALDVPETAIRMFSAMAETPENAHAMLVFGQSFAMLVITYKGALLMTRNIEVTLDAIVGQAEARGAALGRAALEVLRTLDSYERMHSEAPLSTMSVVVPPQGEDVIEVLTDLVYVPVKRFQLNEWVDVAALGDHAERIGNGGSLEEYVAIGASLRSYAEHQGWQTLRMFDERDVRLRKQPWNASLGVKLTSAVCGSALAAGALMTGWSIWIDRQIQQYEQQIQAEKANVALPKAPMELQQLGEMKQRETRQRQLSDAMKSAIQQEQVPYSDYLLALARQTLPELWITDLKVTEHGQDVTLVGRMTDPTRLPLYLSRLEKEPQFQGRKFAQVELRAVTTEQGVMAQVIEFTLRGKPQQVDARKPSGDKHEEAAL